MAPREARSRILVWVVGLLALAIGALEVPGRGYWSPPCILAPLEEQPGGPDTGRDPAQTPQVCLLFLSLNADAFPWPVCFLGHCGRGLSTGVFPIGH